MRALKAHGFNGRAWNLNLVQCAMCSSTIKGRKRCVIRSPFGRRPLFVERWVRYRGRWSPSDEKDHLFHFKIHECHSLLVAGRSLINPSPIFRRSIARSFRDARYRCNYDGCFGVQTHKIRRYIDTSMACCEKVAGLQSAILYHPH